MISSLKRPPRLDILGGRIRALRMNVGQQRAWDHGPNFVLRHFRAPLDAESTNNAELFNCSSLIYIHCCDFSHTFTITIPSSPFLKIRGFSPTLVSGIELSSISLVWTDLEAVSR